MNVDTLDCGHPESLHSSITRGYGQDRDGKRHCYACCLSRELEAMDRDGRINAYLSSDGRHITDWPGGILAVVMRTTVTDAGGFCRGTQITRVWAQDRHGAWWHGRGSGRGMFMRLRRSRDNRVGRR